MKMHVNHLELCSFVSGIYLSLPGLEKREISLRVSPKDPQQLWPWFLHLYIHFFVHSIDTY